MNSGTVIKRCTVCGNGMNNKLHTAYDKLLKIEGEFIYLECGNCGCVQILEEPDDLAKYYPPYYYSYSLDYDVTKKIRPKKVLRARHWLGDATLRSTLIILIDALRRKKIPPELKFAMENGLKQTDSILEIGSGSGRLLLQLSENGFTNLIGIDPYMEEKKYPSGVQIWQKTFSTLIQYPLISSCRIIPLSI